MKPRMFPLLPLSGALLLLLPYNYVHGFSATTKFLPLFQKKQQQQQQQPELTTRPSPTKWPIVGTLPDFLSRGGIDAMCEVYESMYQEYGPVFGMSIMGDDEIIVSDPRLFETQVLKKEGRYPVGASEQVSTFVDYYRDNNLTLASKATSRGPEWKEWRRAVNRDMFVSWETYLPAIAETARTASAVAGREVNGGSMFDDFLSRLAFDMFSSVLYGQSPGTVDSTRATAEDNLFLRNTQRAFDTTGALTTDPIKKLFKTQLYQDFVESMDFTFDVSYRRTKEFAEEARQQQQQQRVQLQTQNDITSQEDETSSQCPIKGIKDAMVGGDQKKKKNPSFIERLVRNGDLSNDEISEVSAPLLMAGVDTTTYIMCWLYLNLAMNPTAQDKLAQELEDVLGGADLTTAQQLEALPYLRACIRESHRLTPGTPISVKVLEQDVDLVVGGDREQHQRYYYRVQAGERISLNLRGIPMDPEYVTRPRDYDPDRFMPDQIEERRGTKYEIIDHPYFEDPFGRGKRQCLGANVAMAEITSSLARMIQDWNISISAGLPQDGSVPWTVKQKLMLKADPFPEMRLEPRQHKSDVVSRTARNDPTF